MQIRYRAERFEQIFARTAINRISRERHKSCPKHELSRIYRFFDRKKILVPTEIKRTKDEYRIPDPKQIFSRHKLKSFNDKVKY